MHIAAAARQRKLVFVRDGDIVTPIVSQVPARGLKTGRYELLFRLAKGGMAEVFVGRLRRDAGFDKLVAVKRMHPHLAEDSSFVEMFLDEARIAATLDSPHIIPTFDVGSEDGIPYLVMKLVQGVPLSRLLGNAAHQNTAIPVPVVLDIGVQSALALAHAHSAQDATGQPLRLVHRDVSPQNILVDRTGHVWLTDFGIARALHSTHETTSYQLKGKLAYMSPEQLACEPLDGRSDVYALGVVLWELLCGRRLFHAPSPLEVMERAKSLAIPDVREVRPGVPSGFARTLAEALHRDARVRTQSAEDLLRSLRRIQAALPPERTTDDDSAPTTAVFVQTMAGEELCSLQQNIRAALAEAAQPESTLAGELLPEQLIAIEESSITAPTRTHWRRWAVVGALVIGAGAIAVGAWTYSNRASPELAAPPPSASSKASVARPAVAPVAIERPQAMLEPEDERSVQPAPADAEDSAAPLRRRARSRARRQAATRMRPTVHDEGLLGEDAHGRYPRVAR